MNAGKNIAKFRKEKELNQEELAQKTTTNSGKKINYFNNSR